jgi:hypothetical protein
VQQSPSHTLYLASEISIHCTAWDLYEARGGNWSNLKFVSKLWDVISYQQYEKNKIKIITVSIILRIISEKRKPAPVSVISLCLHETY